MKKSILKIGFLSLLLFISSYFLPHFLTELLGFVLILFVTLKIGWKEGLTTAVITSIIMWLIHFYFNYEKTYEIVISILLLYFTTPIFIGYIMKKMKNKNKELEETKEKLKEKNNLLESILENAPLGIWLVDENQNPILVNDYFKKHTGFGTGDPENISMTEKELKICKETDNKVIKSGKTQRFEEKTTFRDGKKHILQTIKTKVLYDNNKTLGILGIGLDITKRKQKEEKIKRLSFYDQLTELYNRRYFENELERLDKSRQLPISIIVGDMDNLKNINDNYGHKKGDKFIVKTANILSNSVREEDVVSRIGGDEFAIILPETDYKTADNLIDRISSKFEELNKNISFPFTINISLGCATKDLKSESLEKVFDKADKKMYEKKLK